MASLQPHGYTFRILLLADLHWRLKHSQDRWLDVETPLHHDIAEGLPEGKPIDLVVFAGDLAFSGEKGELKGTAAPNQQDGVDDLLKRFWVQFTRMGAGNPAMFAIPGNHDAKWSTGQEDQALTEKLKFFFDDVEVQNSILEKEETPEVQLIRRSFQDWAEWRQDNVAIQFGNAIAYEHFHEGFLPGDFSCRLMRRNTTLGVVGLNSAFLQLDNSDYEQKLALDSSQLHACCLNNGPQWLSQNHANILITHHPPSWLHPSCRDHFGNNVSIPGLIDLQLNGHLHVAEYESQGKSPDMLVHRIQGISLFGETEFVDRKNNVRKQRLHGYVLIELSVSPDVNRFRFRPRQFTADMRPTSPQQIAVDDAGWTVWTDLPKRRYWR